MIHVVKCQGHNKKIMNASNITPGLKTKLVLELTLSVDKRFGVVKD